MSNRKEILRFFAACPLCGHFVSSLIALVGEGAFDDAVEEEGPWLGFSWQPEIRDLYRQYFDWYLNADTESFSSSCPACTRRFIYQDADGVRQIRVERRPGSRI